MGESDVGDPGIIVAIAVFEIGEVVAEEVEEASGGELGEEEEGTIEEGEVGVDGVLGGVIGPGGLNDGLMIEIPPSGGGEIAVEIVELLKGLVLAEVFPVASPYPWTGIAVD